MKPIADIALMAVVVLGLMALSIALIWSVKTLKATPRPQCKGGPVIKKY